MSRRLVITHASLLATLSALPLVGCGHLNGSSAHRLAPALRAIEGVKQKYAPDSHLAIFNVGLQRRGPELVLTGDVDRAEAKLEAVQAARRAGAMVTDRIRVLPSERLRDRGWGIACVSVANGRELPGHKAEMGTQILMGNVVRLWDRTTNENFTWYLGQSADAYLSWLERETLFRCTREQAEAWQRAPLLIVTAFEDTVRDQARADAQPVSDVVLGDLVKKTGEDAHWFKVELPDGRAGFLAKESAQDYAAWQASRRPTPENIEQTARMFIGRPYVWGGNSPRGLDCSGFTKLVFFLNGVELKRNASHQAQQGVTVPLDPDLSRIQKGDLLFFGRPSRRGRPERVTHVGIYLGNKLFIQSSELVKLSSLDPDSPIRDELRSRTLLRAKRVLTTTATAEARSKVQSPN